MKRNIAIASPRISVVTALNDLSTSPSVLNGIELLVKAGYRIDLIARRWQGSMPPDANWGGNVDIHLSPWNTRKGIPGLVALRHLLLILRILLAHRPVAVIAISPETLVLAAPVAALLGLPLIHFSLEIRYPTNLRTSIQKRLERFAYHFVWFTIVQDEGRGKTLLDSNHLQEADMVFVPNSSGLSVPATGRSSYLRERWKIPADEVIILFAGNITQFTSCRDLVLAAKNWPDNWCLVLHGWSDSPQYLEEIRTKCDGKHTILAEEIVPYERLDQLVSSADIGIALYAPVDRNILEMGHSSGKIWQYLRCGLPVVTSCFPSLEAMVSNGQFGFCVHAPDEVQQALEQILLDYSTYSSHAREYYRHNGDFAIKFRPVLDRVATLWKSAL